MAVSGGGSATVPSLPPPLPKSPPEYPDLYGKRREMDKVMMLEREIGFLEDELKSIEGIPPASQCCKEVVGFVLEKQEPLVPRYRKNRSFCRFWKWLCTPSCFRCCCKEGCSLELKPPSCCACSNACTCTNIFSCAKCNCWSIPKVRCCCCFPCCRMNSCRKSCCCCKCECPSCPDCSCVSCHCCVFPKCLKIRCRNCCKLPKCPRTCNTCYLCC